MALGDPYATLTDLKSYLKVADSVDDTEMTAALASASREIEIYCERQFNKATVATARLFSPTSNAFRVDDFHTTTDLVVATGIGDDTFGTTWTSTDYQLSPLNGIVGGESGWPYYRITGTRRKLPTSDLGPTLRITAQWGWNTVPALVKQACLVIASETLKIKDAPFGVAGYGDYGPIRVRNSPVACRMLAAYRIRPVKVG